MTNRLKALGLFLVAVGCSDDDAASQVDATAFAVRVPGEPIVHGLGILRGQAVAATDAGLFRIAGEIRLLDPNAFTDLSCRADECLAAGVTGVFAVGPDSARRVLDAPARAAIRTEDSLLFIDRDDRLRGLIEGRPVSFGQEAATELIRAAEAPAPSFLGVVRSGMPRMETSSFVTRANGDVVSVFGEAVDADCPNDESCLFALPDQIVLETQGARPLISPVEIQLSALSCGDEASCLAVGWSAEEGVQRPAALRSEDGGRSWSAFDTGLDRLAATAGKNSRAVEVACDGARCVIGTDTGRLVSVRVSRSPGM